MVCVGSKPHISIEVRGWILAFRETGASYRQIAQTIGCSVGTVHHVLQEKAMTGTVEDRSISCRKRVTTEQEDRLITRLSLANSGKTAPRIRVSLVPWPHHICVYSPVSSSGSRPEGLQSQEKAMANPIASP